jgi:hypothetical protein
MVNQQEACQTDLNLKKRCNLSLRDRWKQDVQTPLVLINGIAAAAKASRNRRISAMAMVQHKLVFSAVRHRGL